MNSTSTNNRKGLLPIKLYIGIALLLLITVFTVQNAETVEIRLFFWTISISRALMIFIVLAAGVMVGWILATLQQHKRH